MSVNLSPLAGAGAQFFTDSGTPLTGGLLYTYSAGTTTPATTYTTNLGTVANSNPVVLDAGGRVPYEIWLTAGVVYKFVLKSSVGTTIGTWDNLRGVNDPDGQNFYADTFTTTAGQTAFTLTTSPGTVNALTVSLDGAVLVAGATADFTWTGTTLTLTMPAYAGQSLRVAYSGSLSSSSVPAGSVTNVSVAAGAGVDSDKLAYQSTATGSVSRTVEAKLGDVVSVKDFGAVGDGATDDTAAIQAAITYAQTLSGCTVYFVPGTYKISATLTVTASNVLLLGSGGDMQHDVGTQGASASTKLNWAGSAGGTMVKFASPTGASAQKQNGGGMVGFFLQCVGSAGIGLQVQSWAMGEFRDLGIINPTTTGIDIGVVATLGEARDPQNNRFSQISVRCVEGSGASASILRLDGDATANTSLNLFEQIDGSHVNGSAYLLKNCDNNLFLRCRAYRVSGSGASVEFQGSNISAAETARTNIFFHFSSNAAAVARGTSSYTYASLNNTMLMLDQDNSTPAPTVETGATLHYTRTDNIDVSPGLGHVSIGNSITETNAAKTRIQSNESLHVYNTNSDHVRLDDGTNQWGLSLGNGDLRFLRLAGSGYYKLSLAAIGDYADDTAAAAAGVSVWALYRTGSVIKIRAT